MAIPSIIMPVIIMKSKHVSPILRRSIRLISWMFISNVFYPRLMGLIKPKWFPVWLVPYWLYPLRWFVSKLYLWLFHSRNIHSRLSKTRRVHSWWLHSRLFKSRWFHSWWLHSRLLESMRFHSWWLFSWLLELR
jgi:hypothetical protein